MNKRGFTFIEVVLVVVILGILVVLGIPKFLDLKAEARIAGCKGALAAVRGGIELNHNQRVVRDEDPIHPTLDEVRETNVISGKFGPIGGNDSLVMENGDMPDNPFDTDDDKDNVAGATGMAKGSVVGGGGWAYNENNGTFWANTNTAGVNENTF